MSRKIVRVPAEGRIKSPFKLSKLVIFRTIKDNLDSTLSSRKTSTIFILNCRLYRAYLQRHWSKAALNVHTVIVYNFRF